MPDYPLLPSFSGIDDQLNKQRRLLDAELRASEMVPRSYAGIRAMTTDQYSSWTEDVYESMPWQVCDSADITPLVSAQPFLTPIFLRKGDELYSMGYLSGSTALAGATYVAFSINEPIYPYNPIAVTEDGGSEAWPANWLMDLPFADGSFVVPQTGLFYASIGVKATTPPSLVGRTTHIAASQFGLPGLSGATYSPSLLPAAYADYADRATWEANTDFWYVSNEIPYVRCYRRNEEPTIVS